MTVVELQNLSTKEKLQMMESLWDSLCSKTPSIDSTEWHGVLLAGREQAIRNGSDSFEDWEAAKAELRNQERRMG